MKTPKFRVAPGLAGMGCPFCSRLVWALQEESDAPLVTHRLTNVALSSNWPPLLFACERCKAHWSA